MAARDLPRQQDLIQTIRELRAPRTETDDGWVKVDDPNDEISPPWENGWGPDDPALEVSFHYTRDGHVKFRGNISGGTVGANAFTLPVGYRPEQTEHFDCADLANKTTAIIQVDPDGSVFVWNMA